MGLPRQTWSTRSALICPTKQQSDDTLYPNMELLPLTPAWPSFRKLHSSSKFFKCFSEGPRYRGGKVQIKARVDSLKGVLTTSNSMNLSQSARGEAASVFQL